MAVSEGMYILNQQFKFQGQNKRYNEIHLMKSVGVEASHNVQQRSSIVNPSSMTSLE